MNIPDYVTPIVAHRIWHWDAAGLASLNDSLWVPKQPMVATCYRPACQSKGYNAETGGWKNDAPSENCSCGVYAAKSIGHLQQCGYGWWGLHGDVYLWGKIWEHKLGYRAQYAYPKNLTITFPINSVKVSPFIIMEVKARLETLIKYGVDLFLAPNETCERMLVWSQDSGLNPRALERIEAMSLDILRNSTFLRLRKRGHVINSTNCQNVDRYKCLRCGQVTVITSTGVWGDALEQVCAFSESLPITGGRKFTVPQGPKVVVFRRRQEGDQQANKVKTDAIQCEPVI